MIKVKLDAREVLKDIRDGLDDTATPSHKKGLRRALMKIHKRLTPGEKEA